MSVGPRYDVTKGLERIYKIVKNGFLSHFIAHMFRRFFTLFSTYSLVFFHIFRIVIYSASSVPLRENIFSTLLLFLSVLRAT
jgi:hypothetical protein